MWIVAVLGFLAVARADISGQNPPNGACLCMKVAGVNIRNPACGTVVGSANAPQCYKYKGTKTNCQVGGTFYDFFSVEFGSGGWIAGNYMEIGAASRCQSGGTCAGVEIVTRAQWGARPPRPISNISPVSMVFVHHTVTPHCTSISSCSARMRSIQNYHMDNRGYADIAYSFLVGEDGRAYEGRGWNKRGGHTLGYNSNAVAVSAIGNFQTANPNAAIQSAIRNVIDCAVQQGFISSNHELFGHRDGGCTSCPGINLYNIIRTWPRYSFRDIPKYCRQKNYAEVEEQ